MDPPMEVDRGNEKVEALAPSYYWFYQAFDKISKNSKAEIDDVNFNIHICGGLRSLVYYARWKAAGSRPGNNMAMKIQTGIKIQTRTDTYEITTANLPKFLEEIEKEVKTKYTTWTADTSNYGKISQILNFVLAFGYSMKCTQLGEPRMRVFNQGGGPEEKVISELGFDITRHSQLAFGVGMSAIEASTQKTSIGLAACLMFHKYATQERIKSKWIPAIRYHLIGLPNHEQILQGILAHDLNAQRINSILGDIILMMGDRRKHRFHPMPFMVFKMLQDEEKFSEEKVKNVDFSRNDFLIKCLSYAIKVPSTISIELMKSILAITLLGAQYEDLGIIRQMMGFEIASRRDCGQAFKCMRECYPQTVNVTISPLVVSSFRKAHGYNLQLSTEGQWSSEPVFRGIRKRKVNNLKDNLKKTDSSYQSMGDVVDGLIRVKAEIMERISDETIFGTHACIKVRSAK
ncbi:hypothetical protein JTE90_025052 [Oedothorax gibbosus]|uniref:Nucleoprotein n=1 Tax=Oedothorax gibbosus TaxID=931172 RepID=A0AAV6TS15_9ARAC|nr:hypothetical protein JTE90_025052 [Oedothorax gibbosus]